MVGKNDGINPFTRRVCQKKPSEVSRAILWSMSAQKPTYWSSTLLPPFLDAKYQLLKLRHVQKAKFLKVFGVNSDTANLTLTFHRFCFTKSFRESFRRCRCQSSGTRSSMEFSGQLFMVFCAFSLVSLTESCSRWNGLKDLFPLHKLDDKNWWHHEQYKGHGLHGQLQIVWGQTHFRLWRPTILSTQW